MGFSMDTPYISIPGGEPKGTFGAVIEMILRSRLKLHLDERTGGQDEDVNAYLAGLLVSYIDPAYFRFVSRLISRYEADVHQSVEACPEDPARAYWIYKANADDLMVSLGIFHRFLAEQEADLVRIRRYYTAASSCQKRIYRRPTAVSDIQAKLADATPRYLAILSQTRVDYLRFVRQIPPEGWEAFERQMND
jgi:hypothetical protein